VPEVELTAIVPLGIPLLRSRVDDRMLNQDSEEARDQDVVVEGIGMRFLDDSRDLRDISIAER
jgi:hypothetical protein